MFVVRPKRRRAPAVIVLHEAFGLNDHIRSICRRLAGEGFVAAAPDLYWRLPVRTAPYDQLPRALELRDTLHDSEVVADVQTAVEAAGAEPVGVVGFCMGGRYAFLSAGRIPNIRAVVSFYGGGIVPGKNYPVTDKRPVPPIEYAKHIRGPMLLMFGAEDPLIPPEDVQHLREALEKTGRTDWEIKVYPGAGHGFMCDQRDSYRAEAARDAWARMVDFLKRHLQGSAV